jgi:hypothetical protein
VQIDGEPFNQQQAEEKGRERHGGKHRDAHQMIKQKVFRAETTPTVRPMPQ